MIGKPHPVTGESIKAFILLAKGFEASDELNPNSSSLSGKTWPDLRSRTRSRWSTSSPRPAAARSCAACSRPRSWGCRLATRRRWKTKGRRGKEKHGTGKQGNKPQSARTLESAARRSQGQHEAGGTRHGPWHTLARLRVAPFRALAPSTPGAPRPLVRRTGPSTGRGAGRSQSPRA